MTTTGTWYPPAALQPSTYDPAAGTGGFLFTFDNPPFAPMTTPDPIRAALERLVAVVEQDRRSQHDIMTLIAMADPVGEALTAARAALAAVPEGEAVLDKDEEPDVDQVLRLASIIRRVDGSHSLGAAALAEAILARWGNHFPDMVSSTTPPAPAADLPPDYIDEWITDPRDRSLLEVFHKACNSEGGSADEVILRGLKAVLQDDKSRSYRLQQENRRFREPERTILCDILANGTLLPDPDGTRYGIPPAPAAGEVGELVAYLKLLREEIQSLGDIEEVGARAWGLDNLTRAAALLEHLAAQAPQPVAVSDALIKAECALSDIAEGEPLADEGDPLQWAERRCADTLAIIRPTMRQHNIRTSEWPPIPAHALPLPTTPPAPAAGEEGVDG